MHGDRSTFNVRNFPKALRERIHALAILERKPIATVLVELIEAGFQTQAAPQVADDRLTVPRRLVEALAQQMTQRPDARRAGKKKTGGTR